MLEGLSTIDLNTFNISEISVRKQCKIRTCDLEGFSKGSYYQCIFKYRIVCERFFPLVKVTLM